MGYVLYIFDIRSVCGVIVKSFKLDYGYGVVITVLGTSWPISMYIAIASYLSKDKTNLISL